MLTSLMGARIHESTKRELGTLTREVGTKKEPSLLPTGEPPSPGKQQEQISLAQRDENDAQGTEASVDTNTRIHECTKRELGTLTREVGTTKEPSLLPTGEPPSPGKQQEQISLAQRDENDAQGTEASVDTNTVYDVLEARDMIFDFKDFTYSPRVLGKGAMGIVHKASLRMQSGKDRTVAVKQMLPTRSRASGNEEANEERQALLMEMKMGAKVQPHPNIVDFLGVIRHPIHGPLLAFEFIDGISLQECFQRRQAKHLAWKPNLSTALTWGQQLFAALDALHTLRVPVIHRDVKPSNLMLFSPTQSGSYEILKLIDFGVSCEEMDAHPQGQPDSERKLDTFQRAGSDESKDMTAMTGTYRYMAPEIVKGVQKYDVKVDVYSASLVLYLMITGKRPFEGYAPQVISHRAAIMGDRPPLVDVKSPDLRRMLTLGWQAEPEERMSSRAILDDLTTVVHAQNCRASKWFDGDVKCFSNGHFAWSSLTLRPGDDLVKAHLDPSAADLSVSGYAV